MKKNANTNFIDSRRTFCKKTALFTAGLILPAMEMNAMYNVFNDKKLKIAVIGCGGRGTGALLRTSDDKLDLKFVCCALPGKLKIQKNRLNIKRDFPIFIIHAYFIINF